MRALAASSFLLLASCAIESEQIDEVWFACERDSQCRIVQAVTCSLMPVNRRYARSFAEWTARTRRQDIPTGPCPEGKVHYSAECEDARCTSSGTLRPSFR